MVLKFEIPIFVQNVSPILFFCTAVFGLIALYYAWRMWRDVDPPISGTLTVGIPVYADSDESAYEKATQGFIRDMIKVLGTKMGRAIAIAHIPAHEVSVALTSRRIDVAVVDGDTATQRSADLEYLACRITTLSSLGLVFWDKMPHHVTTVQDFACYQYNSTAVVKDSYEECYVGMFEALEVAYVESLTDLITNIKAGTVRAGLVRLEQAHVLRTEFENIKIMPVSLGKRCVMQAEHIVVARENSELVSLVRRTLERTHRTKALDSLKKQWFGA